MHLPEFGIAPVCMSLGAGHLGKARVYSTVTNDEAHSLQEIPSCKYMNMKPEPVALALGYALIIVDTIIANVPGWHRRLYAVDRITPARHFISVSNAILHCRIIDLFYIMVLI